jgi:hypothetical protein
MTIVSEIRIISGDPIELEGPCVKDGFLIEVFHGSHDAILELGCDADMAQDRAGEPGEKALDEVEPGTGLGVKMNSKPCAGCAATQALVSLEMWAE